MTTLTSLVKVLAGAGSILLTILGITAFLYSIAQLF